MRILSRIIICLLIFFLVMSICVEYKANAITMKDIADEAGSIIDKGKDKFSDTMGGDGIDKITDPLLGIAQILMTIGVGVILIVGVVMGIKYMSASPEEAAKLKQQLVGLVVAAVVVLGAWTIWSVAIDIASKLEQ